MTDRLSVHHAQINTATVDIRVVSISGKRLSLATFRQIPWVRLIDDDATLLVQPWGWVNYHPDCDWQPRNHRHILCQLNGELGVGTLFPPGTRAVTNSERYAELWDWVHNDLPQLYIGS